MRSEVIRMASAEPSVNFNLLHRTCKLVVLLCFLHISVTVFFYVRSLDIRVAFVQNQQTRNGTAEANPPLDAKEAEQAEDEQAGKSLKRCPETSPLLVGPLRVEFNIPVSPDTIRKENNGVRPGGRYKPDDCVALQKVAIVIPFRKRDEHLKFWLYYLHPILRRQQLDYGVYVINQDGDEIFNRAKLLNVGYVEAMKEYDYDCFVFSDVDLIPMDDRNIYKCFSQPRHLSVSMDKFGFRLPYNQYFGGVSSMMKEQYLSINGFPNNYWGWGGEDDDIYNRLASKGMSISRPSGEVGKCRMIRHERDKRNEPNPQREVSQSTEESRLCDVEVMASSWQRLPDHQPLRQTRTTSSKEGLCPRRLSAHRVLHPVQRSRQLVSVLPQPAGPARFFTKVGGEQSLSVCGSQGNEEDLQGISEVSRMEAEAQSQLEAVDVSRAKHAAVHPSVRADAAARRLVGKHRRERPERGQGQAQ